MLPTAHRADSLRNIRQPECGCVPPGRGLWLYRSRWSRCVPASCRQGTPSTPGYRYQSWGHGSGLPR
nr:MAG TPA: hypothetical protein [Caudoviricetes sp.]